MTSTIIPELFHKVQLPINPIYIKMRLENLCALRG